MTGERGDYVVLLHGLGRTALSMTLPQLKLQAAGFEAVNIHYPSRHEPIEELARGVASKLRSKITDADRDVHFLTHSMGTGAWLSPACSRIAWAIRLAVWFNS